jgi:hypothetical protein
LGLGLFLAGASLPAQSPPVEHAAWPSGGNAPAPLTLTDPPPVPQGQDSNNQASALAQAISSPADAPSWRPRGLGALAAARTSMGLQAEESEQQATPFNPRGGLETDERTPGYQIQLEPPGPERLFKLDSEPALHERWQQQANDQQLTGPIQFPEEPILSKEPYTPRVFPPNTEQVEPHYVCYKRLYFEDLNSERYGWDLGFIQPFVSAGIFFWDVATLPYHMGTEPCRCYECSAGYCLPGDPVPYLIYPPELSLTGAILEAGTIVGLYGIFPG